MQRTETTHTDARADAFIKDGISASRYDGAGAPPAAKDFPEQGVTATAGRDTEKAACGVALRAVICLCPPYRDALFPTKNYLKENNMKRRNRTVKTIVCVMLALLMGVPWFSGCSGTGTQSDVNFWIYGTDSQLEMYYQLAEEFNNTYGAEHGITVRATEVLSSAYMGTVTNLMGSSTAPDIVIVEDADFKKWVIGNYLADITDIESEYPDIELGEIAPVLKNRLRYDVQTNTSDEDDPLYALPLDARPTALYFNKGLMEEAGIIVISVDEEDMDAWNNNKIADNYGRRKSDYPTLNGVTVPQKGYYRSKNPYYFDELSEGWVKPDVAGGEILVFNNRIAMNWDEVEDLAMYFSYSSNPGRNNRTEWGTRYGYFTETWFNYGWSVGGDCLEDLTGEGDWTFSLLDPNPNYIVKEGCTFTGRTGVVYSGGEALAFSDKMEAAEGEVLIPGAEGDYYRAEGVTTDENGLAIAGTKAGIWSEIQTEMAKGDESALIELPSTRTAFKRYLKLGTDTDTYVEDSSGLDISPNPADITDINPAYKQFYTGELLCFVGESPAMREIAVYADDYGLEWDIAPLVRYKRYANPADPNDDTVEALGVEAGHSRSGSMGINRLSTKIDQAKAFVLWAAGIEGQRVRARLGFFPSQEELVDEVVFDGDYAPSNALYFAEAVKYQRPGDWWYMPDTLWVEAWCIDLNTNVRNGRKTFDAWLPTAIANTYNRLKNYSQYDR